MTPGFIESEMIQGKFLFKGGKMEFDPDMRDVSSISLLFKSLEAIKRHKSLI